MAFAVTYPDTLEVIVGEQLNLSIDFTNVMAFGDSISTPTVTIINNATNELVPSAIGTVSFVSNLLKFTLSSSPLHSQGSYTIQATGIVNSVNPISILLLVEVVF